MANISPNFNILACSITYIWLGVNQKVSPQLNRLSIVFQSRRSPLATYTLNYSLAQ
ncbi:MAG: hypothetical protein KME09_16560 [Pleurocapsa minor HA4230-MV1]|nr:hypothetical protein [Pleurocapsa minor HA4230-MV1]